MTHALKYPGRALANVPTALDRSVWLVGTTSLREQNEVCLVEYDYADERVILQDTFVHPREVWDISSSEQDDSLFCTLHGSGSGQGVTVWRREEGVRQLSAQAEVPALQSRGWRAQWHPEEKQIVVVEDVAVTVWDVQELGSGKREPAAEVAAEDERASFCAASVQPSAPAVLAAAAGRAVVLADTRAAHGPAQQLALHELPVRDVAFSGSHPHLLLSGGEDGQLLVLDLRHGSGGENAPGQVAKLQAHRHWVWRAAFNPQHPELVASVSSDASVCLWRVPAFGGADDSTASPSRRDATETTGAKAAAVFERHEDSVYGVSWSAADPWVLASVSYDSQVAAHAVPSNLKYEILI